MFKKSSKHSVIMTGSYGGDRIINHRITDQKRHRHDLSTRQNNGVDIHPKHRNISSVDITHFLLIGDVASNCNGYSSTRAARKMP
jgi:hypothetical protein